MKGRLLFPTVILIASSTPFLFPTTARAAGILASQIEDSASASAQTSCDNSCNDIIVGSQTFTASFSGELGSIEVHTKDFGTNSSNPDSNSCYLSFYDDAGAKLAASDNSYAGYSCGGNLLFDFKTSHISLEEGNRYRWSYVFGGQNFSRVRFLGSATDTIDGSFSLPAIGDAAFTVFAALQEPASPRQILDDDETPLAPGGTSTSSFLYMTASLPSRFPDLLQLQLEVEPFYVPFTGIPTYSGPFKNARDAYAPMVSISTDDLPNGSYHWQMRTADQNGNISRWVPYGNGSDTPDFFIEDPSSDAALQDTVTSYVRDARPDPCFETRAEDCALKPSSVRYDIPLPLRLSAISFDWGNSGGNNCDNVGHYYAVIFRNKADTEPFATSTDDIYIGCGNTHGESSLHFSGDSIPSTFYLAFRSNDGLQGGSYVSISNVTIRGTFDPVPSPTEPEVREPVVIVPGIPGSRLADASGAELWPDMDRLIASFSDAQLDALILAPDGSEPIGQHLTLSDIVRTITSSIPFVSRDVYQPLIARLSQEGYEEGRDLFVAPYDWRLDIASSAAQVGSVFREAAAHSPNGRIDILTHSMGGLVAREYLLMASDTSFVDRIVFVAPPWLGAPQMFKVLQYGDDLGFGIGPLNILNPAEIKKIAQNFPSAYELLPSRRYVDGVSGGYVIDARTTVPTVLNFDATKLFLTSPPADSRNPSLIERADSFHSSRDITTIPGIDAYEIIGCQNPSASRFIIQDGDRVKIERSSGDGTVPLSSAFDLADDYHVYFSLHSENGDDHSGLVTDPGIFSLMDAIIRHSTSSLALAPLGVSTSTEDCLRGRSLPQQNETTLEIDSHGPAALDVYDAEGRHAGAASNESPSIPGSSYESVAQNNFLILPASGTYHFQASPIATGTLDLTFKVLDISAKPVESATYIGLSLKGPSTTISAELIPSSTARFPSLLIGDTNNDSALLIATPTALLSPEASLDVTPPELSLGQIPEMIEEGSSEPLIFSATSDALPIATTSASIDGEKVEEGFPLGSLQPGDHILLVEATDAADNYREARKRFTVSSPVSTSAPSVQISVPAPAKKRCRVRAMTAK